MYLDSNIIKTAHTFAFFLIVWTIDYASATALLESTTFFTYSTHTFSLQMLVDLFVHGNLYLMRSNTLFIKSQQKL